MEGEMATCFKCINATSCLECSSGYLKLDFTGCVANCYKNDG